MLDVVEHLRSKSYAFTTVEALGPEFEDVWQRADAFVERMRTSDKARAFADEFESFVKTDAELEDAESLLRREWEDIVAERNQIASAKAQIALIAERAEQKAAGARLTERRERLKTRTQAYKVEHGRVSGQRRILTGGGLAHLFRATTGYLGRPLAPQDVLVRLAASRPILDIAGAYLGDRVKLRVPDAWFTPAPTTGGDYRRIGAQNWHRDTHDLRILKCFVYFTDVDIGSGAMEVIGSTQPDTPAGKKLPPRNATGYVTTAEIDETFPQAFRTTLIGRRGQVLFADTACFHRGGYTSKHHRVVSQFLYLRGDARSYAQPGQSEPQFPPIAGENDRLVGYDAVQQDALR